MLSHYLRLLKASYFSSLRREEGQSLIILALAFLGLIAMLGLALDLSMVYLERIRLERALDAATLAAVVELPLEEEAMIRAVEYLQLNDYDVADGDVTVLVRGCVGTANVYENGTFGNGPLPPKEGEIVGAQYITANPDTSPWATFAIDTGAYQIDDGQCDPGNELFGTADKVRIAGQVNVKMNFMQFFGWEVFPLTNESVSESITLWDIMVVMDVSGSMEYDTACYDCWVRTDPENPTFPDNGYFNPLHPKIPDSELCTEPPESREQGDDYDYLVHEAELYSRDVPLHGWKLQSRSPGQGFWALQRGSRRKENPLNVEEDKDNDIDIFYYQGNQAGNPDLQSSNVCGPAVGGSVISCNVITDGKLDSICDDETTIQNDKGDVIRDCSAYVKAQPYVTYDPGEGISGAGPSLHGAAYNSECDFAGGGCWGGDGPGNVPWLEYDFTPTWSGNTHIWIRAIGSGERAYKWAGDSPESLENWDDVIYWQVGGGSVTQNSAASPLASNPNNKQIWRDNRAIDPDWRWIKLGQAPTTVNAQSVLKLYQGSAGYKVDKIVFTDNPGNSLPWADGEVGPPASFGSATREACNVCNPAFGQEVDSAECTCRTDGTESGYGSGQGCTQVPEDTTVAQLADDLYSGPQPMRSAQEAVKNFVQRLDARFYQVGFIAFSDAVINDVTGGRQPYRVKLQCRRSADDVNQCVSSPAPFLEVRRAVERQWPRFGSNIADGLREALEELGVKNYVVDHSCSTGIPGSINDGRACDRQGGARRVIILLTDGLATKPEDSEVCPATPSGNPLVPWEGEISGKAYDCALTYAAEAALNDVIIYTIGLGQAANTDFLTTLATGIDPDPAKGKQYFTTGGGQFYLGSDISQLDLIFEQILSNVYVRIVG